MVQICIAVSLLRDQSSCSSWSVVLVVVVSRRGHCSAKLIDRARALLSPPSLSPRVGVGVRVGLRFVTSCWNTRFLGAGSQSRYEQNPPHCKCHRRHFIDIISAALECGVGLLPRARAREPLGGES